MELTDTPRVQNTNLLNCASEIAEIIKSGNLKRRARDAEKLVSRLSEEFDAHLDEENSVLLPYLFQHPNDRIRKTAKRSERRLRQIAPQIRQWQRCWQAPDITQEPDRFHAETRQLFIKLKAQIDEENNQLFPLVELEK